MLVRGWWLGGLAAALALFAAACGDSGHVLLGHTRVYIPQGKTLRERLHHSETKVTYDEHDPLILLSNLQQCPDERRPHGPRSSSDIASLNSWSSGAR